VRFVDGIEAGTPLITGSSSDILLWLYSRIELASDERARSWAVVSASSALPTERRAIVTRHWWLRDRIRLLSVV